MIDPSLVFWDTIGGIIKNLPFFFLIIWGVKTIAKEMPKWIGQYEEIKERQRKIDWALGRK